MIKVKMSAFKRIPLIASKQESSTFEIPEKILKNENILRCKRDATNRDTCQQLFLIGIGTNLGYSFVIQKPRKKSSKAMNSFIIEKIYDEDDNLIFDKDSTESSLGDEKVDKKTYISNSNDFLINLYENKHNCYIERKKNRKDCKSKQFQRIDRIHFNNYKYTYSYIKEIGLLMNKKLEKELVDSNCIIRSYNKEIVDYYTMFF